MSEGAAAMAAVGAAAVAQAVKAAGVIVRLEPGEFMKLLAKQDAPLVVCAAGGLFSITYEYLFGYKGLAFYTKSRDALPLPSRAETVVARSIWIPG